MSAFFTLIQSEYYLQFNNIFYFVLINNNTNNNIFIKRLIYTYIYFGYPILIIFF